jgi:crossover junction endodeoxyribonuclease RuvC
MKIGIDPGNSGAIAFLNSKGECLGVVDMPTMTLNGKKQQVNAVELARIIERWRNLSNEPLVAFLEAVSAMPGQGVSSMFNFGMGYGIVQGVLATQRIPFILVRPQQWKKRAGLIGAEKDKARTLAQQMYPSVDLSRKKDIGRADSILIARFGESTKQWITQEGEPFND